MKTDEEEAAPPFESPAVERENNFNWFEDFHLEIGSSQGQNLTFTVLYVPHSLGSSP